MCMSKPKTPPLPKPAPPPPVAPTSVDQSVLDAADQQRKIARNNNGRSGSILTDGTVNAADASTAKKVLLG